MYPSEYEIKSTVDSINRYIRKELNQSHSSVEERWVAEILYREHNMALHSCFPSDHSTIARRVFNIAQKRIDTIYSEYEKHLEDIKDIGRPNNGGKVESSTTSYSTPLERGVWENAKGNDKDIWFIGANVFIALVS